MIMPIKHTASETTLEIFANSMSYSLIHDVPQFSFRRLLNRGIVIDNATLEAVSLGLVPSFFLIHVEYRKMGTADVLRQVIIEQFHNYSF